MHWLNLLGIAVGLAMDAFAVAIAAGLVLPTVTRRHVFRLAWHFGFFQFLMPIVGWLAGKTLAGYVAGFDHWIAFVLLYLIAGKMLYEAIFLDPQEKSRSDPTRGWLLVMLSVATSLDALAVGFSLAMLKVSIWLPAVVIGVVAGTFTTAGMTFGRRLGARWEHRAEVLGAVVLLVIGARIVISHLWA